MFKITLIAIALFFLFIKLILKSLNDYYT